MRVHGMSPRGPVGRATLLAALLCGLTSGVAAQQASVQGFVTAANTRSPLEGVVVALEVGGRQVQGALTDRNGFYQMGGVTPGEYTLSAALIGYLQKPQHVSIAPGARLSVSFQLETDPVLLEGIVVTAKKGATVHDLGRQVVTPADMRLVPVPAGSGDLATYLQTLPGVVTTSDRGGQIFVRGGTPAENLVLVDGIPIYQPFHILGFFSVFPEDLVSSVDLYAGGFGARYNGRTSSVLDVRLRDGNPNGVRGMASAGPFLAEALVEGPAGSSVSWLASARRSLVEETSPALIGTLQPYTFDSQLLKFTVTGSDETRCSALLLRTSDRGRLDPEERESHVAWGNLLGGGHCVTPLAGLVRLLDVGFSYTSLDNSAVTRGSSSFRSGVKRAQVDVHTTSMIRSVPLYAGFQMYAELMSYDLTELFGIGREDGSIFGLNGYLETELTVGGGIEVRPGVVLTGAPRGGVEPRLRGSWAPFGDSDAKLQGAVGLYRQALMGTSDMRDVSSVFMAWMSPSGAAPLEAVHGILGWQQTLAGGLHGSVEVYYKNMKHIPVPAWRALAQFTTRLERADGEVYGADTRIEYRSPHLSGFVGYGYSRTEYELAQLEFMTWFGSPVQRYHPPHDRRHQLNVVAKTDLAGFEASARWQFGSGLPFTRPRGFEETFNFTGDLPDVREVLGTTRLVLDRPFNGRLPATHRLDVSVERGFDLPVGRLVLQAGAINAYDQRNMFYYDLFTGRRADQLPFAPYASITLRTTEPGS